MDYVQFNFFHVIYGITIFNMHMAYILLGWLCASSTFVHFRLTSHVLCDRCVDLCWSYVERTSIETFQREISCFIKSSYDDRIFLFRVIYIVITSYIFVRYSF